MINRIKLLIITLLSGALFVFAGCGGGSGGGESAPGKTLTLTLATSGVQNGVFIGGIQGKITLPAGTTIRLDPTQTGSVLPGLFTLTGNAATSQLNVNTFVAPVFAFGILNTNGFTGGDFATLVVDVLSGAPAVADFTISNPSVIDTSSNTINGATFTIR